MPEKQHGDLFLRQEGNTEIIPDEPSPICDSYYYQNEKWFKTI